ncbi:MAG: hypothetical protein AAGH90_00050 [Pseudomonadota bacterium]
MRHTHLLFLGLTCIMFAQPTTAQQSRTENCFNQIDDNLNGEIDCYDDQCKNLWICLSIPEQCANGIDDDRNGYVDCTDPACNAVSVCSPRLEDCGNGSDDDGDGDVDCADASCEGTSVCTPKAELCLAKGDEDGDGDADCEDADCEFTAACLLPEDQRGPKTFQGRREISPFLRPAPTPMDRLIKKPKEESDS